MFAFWYLVLCTFLFGQVISKNIHPRQAKMLREAYTTTIIHEELVTKLVPSSCILVKPTLPPCREIRYLNFPMLWGYDNSTKSHHDVDSPQRTEPAIQETNLSWGEYFGIYRPTVTVTQNKRVTKMVENPNIVITYSVMGCRPTSLPEHMDRCPESATEPTIIPTPSTPVAITEIPKLVQPINNQVAPNILPSNEVLDISPSINGHQDENKPKATEQLS